MWIPLFIFCIPFMFIAAIVIVVVIITYYTAKEKKVYQREVALQKTRPEPSIVMDTERIKILYRMELMDLFIRKTFQSVKDWKVVGDDSMHQAFFSSNLQLSIFKYVTVYFLDGTEKTVKVNISKFKDMEKDVLSLYEIPRPDNEQGVSAEDEDTNQKSEESGKSKEKVEKKPERKPSTSNTPAKELANEFLKRKDVYDILEKEHDVVLEKDIPNDEVFELCKKYLMEEHGIILYKATTGWGFSFS